MYDTHSINKTVIPLFFVKSKTLATNEWRNAKFSIKETILRRGIVLWKRWNCLNKSWNPKSSKNYDWTLYLEGRFALSFKSATAWRDPNTPKRDNAVVANKATVIFRCAGRAQVITRIFANIAQIEDDSHCRGNRRTNNLWQKKQCNLSICNEQVQITDLVHCFFNFIYYIILRSCARWTKY